MQQRKPAPPSGPPPDQAALHEAALAHLARYATTGAGLLRVLDRRIDRWARLAGEDAAAAVPPARAAARAVLEQLRQLGLIDDAAFAERRAARMLRAGRSPAAAAAQLRARGVDQDLAESAVPDDPDAVLAAALTLARKRRIGPFRTGEASEPEAARREQSVLARAGFGREVTLAALAMDPDEAENRIIAFRRD